MIRRFGWFIGLNNTRSLSTKRLPDAKPHPAQVRPVAIMETMQEVAIYIHRFHNLDLFQQGWYQIKITMRWEDSLHGPPGTPSRVVQYEAPDLGPDDVYGIWRINDSDNSFSTQPFRIKYVRQDVLLSVMVSFNLSLGNFELSFHGILATTQTPSMVILPSLKVVCFPKKAGCDLSTSAIIVKFELMYAPITETGSGLQASLDACSAAVHEFRIPPKALLGVHSYCPVHFDAFHSVLVDTTVHISLLESGSNATPKGLRGSQTDEDISREKLGGVGQAVGPLTPVEKNDVAVLRAMVAARKLLLEELQNLSNAIECRIDISDFASEVDGTDPFSSPEDSSAVDNQASGPGKPQNGVEKENRDLDFSDDGLLHSVSRDALLHSFHLVGNQILYLWSAFLNFHRANKTSLIEHLRDAWAADRRAEWSIWMMYTKVELPNNYISNGSDEPSHRHRRASSLYKLGDDPSQSAAMRADLHRRSIAQMRINNRSIQDLHIFGDPSRIPIVIVERVVNAPRRTLSANSFLRNGDFKDSVNLPSVASLEPPKGQTPPAQQNGRILKVVVFVHGFQGHHLDLRLVRNQWLLIDPKIEFLMSEANEEKTGGDFREMGQRLALEVVSFLKKKMDKIARHGSVRTIKLSFVGHSIGNLIIRTALADCIMEPYVKYLHSYVSVSGPHLGYLYSSNSLFNSGLWLLKKLKGTQCIHQLTFTDDPDLQHTFLYQLCKQKTLESFKNIILLSSPQDGYVPYHSARIEFCQAASTDNSKKGKIFVEMLNNCLDQIRASSVENRVFMRCDVNFDSSLHGRNLNTLIGRAAHVEFVESDIFARFIMWSFPEFFR